MAQDNELHRLAAFSDNPSGGNPAGVWIGEQLPDEATMQRIAAEVGFSETAFVAPMQGLERNVRYYSPEAEVSFCGHATIATGAAAAALGGYLRDASLVDTPTEFEIRQGQAMGRPSLLTVTVPATGGIIVTGTAVAI